MPKRNPVVPPNAPSTFNAPVADTFFESRTRRPAPTAPNPGPAVSQAFSVRVQLVVPTAQTVGGMGAFAVGATDTGTGTYASKSPTPPATKIIGANVCVMAFGPMRYVKRASMWSGRKATWGSSSRDR